MKLLHKAISHECVTGIRSKKCKSASQDNTCVTDLRSQVKKFVSGWQGNKFITVSRGNRSVIGPQSNKFITSSQVKKCNWFTRLKCNTVPHVIVV